MEKKTLFVIGLVFLLAGCAQVPLQETKLAVQCHLSHETIEPGHAFLVNVHAKSGLRLHVNGWNVSAPLIEYQPEKYQTYLAVPLEAVIEPCVLTITARKNEKDIHVAEKMITVVPRSPFKVTRLWIKKFAKYDFDTESALMSRARDSVDLFDTDEKLKLFQWPVKGRITELFGVKRIYNGGIRTWYHGGFDIAAPGGTPIHATAKGVVILTREFEAHGNVTLVYHGFGVVSTYLHQSKILVKEGQHVTAGEVIGEVGTTGSSTGNHLHFQINVHNVQVSPDDFLSVDHGLFEK